MNELQEFLDVYDENKNKTGKTINRKDRELLEENEFVLCVHCWIINSKKEVLITQRSMNVNRGGKWEDTHGAVRASETSLEGIKRELKEEIGLNIKDNELQFVKTLKRKKVLRDCYILFKDVTLEDINFNDNEVMDCKFVTLEELKQIIQNGESTFLDFSQTIFGEIDINKLMRK